MTNYARFSGYLPPGGSFNGSGKYVTDCPRCHKRRKFSWDPELKRGICFAGLCTARCRGEDAYRALFEGHGQASGLHLVPRDYVAELRREPEERVKVQDPWAHPVSREFLGGPPPRGRGLDRETVRASGMGGDGRRIWVDLDPVCRGFPPYRYQRLADGSGPWMPKEAGAKRTAYVYGLKLWEEREPWGQVTLFEGVFDVLGTGMVGRGLALMGASLSDDLARHLSEQCGVVKAYYWPDPDDAGQKGAMKAADTLSGWGVECFLVDTGGRPEMNPKFVPQAEARRIFRELGWVE